MVKLLILIRKRSDVSDEEFLRYYEEKHIATVQKLRSGIAARSPSGYRRNFLKWNSDVTAAFNQGRREDRRTREISVVTEMEFEDESHAMEFARTLLDPSVFEGLRTDERNFMAEDGITFCLVDTRGRS